MDTTGLENSSASQWPPGTVRLNEHHHTEIIRHPVPTNDPNDPLNWSNLRKAVNFGLTCYYTLMVFVFLDIITVIYGPLMTDLGFGTAVLNNSFGADTAGLAVGCIFLVPFALKFGRRPVYLFSTSVSFAMAIWLARMQTAGDLYGANIVAGVAGSISEAICQMTVADLFFVHQRATMNGIFLIMQSTGAYFGPVVAGYIADSQGWRWIWWWTTIFLGVCLTLFALFYEETKFLPIIVDGMAPTVVADESCCLDEEAPKAESKSAIEPNATSTSTTTPPNVKLKTYRQRMTLLTTTPGSFADFIRHIYQPFIAVFTIPGVAYAAIIYGSLLAWFSVLLSVMSIYMTYPPYNFSSRYIGLMNLAPFIGSIIGSIYAGPLSDYCIIQLSKRNDGIYEPEMRLWLALPPVVLTPLALIMFGLCLVHGVAWISLAIALGLFGACYSAFGDIALTYLIDSYKDIVGDSLVAVAFTRNACATAVAFALTPWIDSMGLQNTFVLSTCVSFVMSATTIPMLIWGKTFRVKVAPRYEKLRRMQFDRRG